MPERRASAPGQSVLSLRREPVGVTGAGMPAVHRTICPAADSNIFVRDRFMKRPGSGNGKAGSLLAHILLRIYPMVRSERLRSRLRRMVTAMERGAAYSGTIREIYRRYYGVDVGLYTAGPCRIKPSYLHRGTTFGRYTSVAESVRTFTRHHPRNLRSTHGLFYNPALGRIHGAPMKFGSLEIGHGAWIGENAVILHPAERIGVGAIIAPGSVVYTNVPPYAIVSGNPASVTGYRFSKEIIAELLASCWWEKSPEELEGLSEAGGRMSDVGDSSKR
jgi:virginiamycin A acetyltransferase